MAAPFRIESLTLTTTRGESAVYAFERRITAVTGPIGTGKSSMMELIKHALGGNAKLMPAIRDNVRRVILALRIGGARLELSRDIDGRMVDVFDVDAGVNVESWATTNRRNLPRASQQLLGLLGFPEDLRVPRRRVRPGTETVPISFFDLFRYLYLTQNGIDISVVGHDDRNLDNKRRAVFELVYGLTSPELLELSTKLGQISGDEDKVRAESAAVAKFLSERQGSLLQLDERHSIALSELAHSEASLAQVKAAAALDIEGQSNLRSKLALLRRSLSSAEEERDARTADIQKGQALVAQLRLDEQRIRRALAAGSALSGLEFSVCPRCDKGLSHLERGDQCCVLCGQPETADEVDSELRAELDRLTRQLEESLQLLAEDQELLFQSESRVNALSNNLNMTAAEFDEQSRSTVSPRLDAIESWVRSIEKARAQVHAVVQAKILWNEQSAMLDQIDALDARAAELRRRESVLKAELSDNDARVERLSETFDDIVRGLHLAWYESAKVDDESYLPIINGEPFDQLSVGGARKTLVNLAYHLANLTYAMADSDVLLPNFLIIDSPRKNVGSGPADSRVGESIYYRLSLLQSAYQGEFQVIVVDNDLPASAREWIGEISLSYTNPLIPGVDHPGAGVETV